MAQPKQSWQYHQKTKVFAILLIINLKLSKRIRFQELVVKNKGFLKELSKISSNITKVVLWSENCSNQLSFSISFSLNSLNLAVIFVRGHSVLSVVTMQLMSFALLRASQMSHQIPGIPEFPTVHEHELPFPWTYSSHPNFSKHFSLRDSTRDISYHIDAST